MSITALSLAFKTRGLRPRHKLVLLYLADTASDGDEGGEIRETLESLCESCDMAPKRMERVLDDLANLQLVRTDDGGALFLCLEGMKRMHPASRQGPRQP